MRTSSMRVLPAVAAVAGAAALAGTFPGTFPGTALAATGPRPAADLNAHDVGDGPHLGQAPSTMDVDLMSFRSPRLRSSDLIEDPKGERRGHRGYDSRGHTDFRNDRAREHYSHDCGYRNNHTDDGLSFSECDIHSDGFHNNDEEAELKPYWKRGEEYYSRDDGEVKTSNERDFDPHNGYLRDESTDFNGDWRAQYKRQQAEKKRQDAKFEEGQRSGTSPAGLLS